MRYRFNPDDDQWEYYSVYFGGWRVSSELAGRTEDDGKKYLDRQRDDDWVIEAYDPCDT